MNQILKFEINKIELIDEVSNSQLTKVRMGIVSEGNNKHNLPISWETIQLAKNSLVGKPVLCHYIQNNNGGVYGGHDPEEIPIGVFLRIDEIYEETLNGKRWLFADAYLWKKYFPEVIDVLRKNNGESNISMEIQVLETQLNDKNQECITMMVFQGVTLIGVQPAIEGAKAIVLQFSELVKETEELLHTQFQIPDIVKQNAQKGLLLKKNNSKGSNVVNTAIANQLINNEFADLELINNISKFSISSKTNISQLLLGGIEGFEWVDKILNPEVKECENVIEFAKKDIGTGEKIEIDLSKDSADMTGSWGDVDKTNLRNTLLKASNYKALIKACYLIIDEGFENSPSTKLHYPVCKVSNGKLILSANGCKAALSRLEQNTDDPHYASAKSKLKKYYKKLELETTNFLKKEGEKVKQKTKLEVDFSLNSSQILDLFESELKDYKYKNGDYEYNKYYVNSFDDEYVYVYNCEASCHERMKYTYADSEMEVDMNSAEEVINAGWMPIKSCNEPEEFAKNPEVFAKIKEAFSHMDDMMPMDYNDKFVFGMDKSTMKMMAIPYSHDGETIVTNTDGKKNAKGKIVYSVIDEGQEPDEDDFAVLMSMMKTMFTSDENTLAVAQANLNEKEAEYYKKLSDMESQMTEMKKLMNPDMEKEMKDMMEKMSALETENEELKKFKADVEEKEKTSRVEFTLTDVIDVMPKEKIDELREDSKNFALDNLTIWENKVKAEAFTFSKGKTNKDGFIRVGLPFSINDKKSGSVWDNLK